MGRFEGARVDCFEGEGWCCCDCGLGEEGSENAEILDWRLLTKWYSEAKMPEPINATPIVILKIWGCDFGVLCYYLNS